MEYYTKEQILEAERIVANARLREEKMAQLKEDIADTLSQFEGKFSFKFIGKQTIFAIDAFGSVKIGVSNCQSGDAYNKLIGKAIAIRKAFKMPVHDIVELVEPEITKPVTAKVSVQFSNNPITTAINNDMIRTLKYAGII